MIRKYFYKGVQFAIFVKMSLSCAVVLCSSVACSTVSAELNPEAVVAGFDKRVEAMFSLVLQWAFCPRVLAE